MDRWGRIELPGDVVDRIPPNNCRRGFVLARTWHGDAAEAEIRRLSWNFSFRGTLIGSRGYTHHFFENLPFVPHLSSKRRFPSVYKVFLILIRVVSERLEPAVSTRVR